MMFGALKPNLYFKIITNHLVSFLGNTYIYGNFTVVTAKFQVLFLEDASLFLDSLDPAARAKILYNIRKAQITNDQQLFKKLIAEIWEFRTQYNRTYYRLFAFWDKTDTTMSLVIATHGLIKRTGTIPKKELRRVISLRQKYFTNRDNRK